MVIQRVKKAPRISVNPFSTAKQTGTCRGGDEMASDIASYASTLLVEAREELGRADSKVSILLAAAGVAASVLAGASVAKGASFTHLPLWAEILGAVGFGSYVLGTSALGLALLPRTKHHSAPAEPYFFGHVATYRTPDTLAPALKRAAECAERRTIDQLWHVSRIVVRKYQLLRAGMILLSVGLLLFGLTTLATGRLT